MYEHSSGERIEDRQSPLPLSSYTPLLLFTTGGLSWTALRAIPYVSIERIQPRPSSPMLVSRFPQHPAVSSTMPLPVPSTAAAVLRDGAALPGWRTGIAYHPSTRPDLSPASPSVPPPILLPSFPPALPDLRSFFGLEAGQECHYGRGVSRAGEGRTKDCFGARPTLSLFIFSSSAPALRFFDTIPGRSLRSLQGYRTTGLTRPP